MIHTLFLAAAILAQTPAQRPNIIVIVADDLGYGDVGYQGGAFRTPNIDRLAVDGVRLQRFYTYPYCTPTRASLMTGQFAHRMGLQQIIWPWNTYGLSPEIPTLSELLRAGGYQTWAFGKWHLGHATAQQQPLGRGFDYHVGNYTGSIHPLNHKYFGVLDFHENGRPLRTEEFVADVLADRFVKQIDKSDGRPFFAYLAFTSPHIPYGTPPSYDTLYSMIENRDRAAMGRMITHMDDTIGKIVDALGRKGLSQNTFIWFLSDNGGDVPLGADNRGLRAGKGSMYEGGIRSVSFVHGPEVPHGQVTDQFFHAVDILPTICHLAGVPSPTNVDGIDATPFIRETQKWEDRTIPLFVLGSKESLSGGMIRGKYKLLFQTNGSTELYNVFDDPSEQHPLTNASIQQRVGGLFVNEYDRYIRTPKTWYAPKGYPEGYQFPRYWGEPQVQILAQPDDAPLEQMGVPSEWRKIMMEATR